MDWEAYINEVLKIAQTGKWPQRRVPEISARVRVAKNSLLAQDPNIFRKSATEIAKIIMAQHNSGIRKILKDTPPEAFALSILESVGRA